MSKEPTIKKGYVHLKKAWYAASTLKYKPHDFVDDICFYIEGPDDSMAEAVVEWIRLGDKIDPLLRMFDDAWPLFGLCPELFADIAKLPKCNPLTGDISTKDFEAVLKRHGFKDETPKTQPSV